MILGDWQVATIYQAQTGFPFTISVFGDTANAGALLNVNPVRANAVPGVSPYLTSDQRSGDMWYQLETAVREVFRTLDGATVPDYERRVNEVVLLAFKLRARRRPDRSRKTRGQLDLIR